MIELCRITGASHEDSAQWVEEGAFEPQGARVEEWWFSGTGVALALDLLDQIEALRKQLARYGNHGQAHDAGCTCRRRRLMDSSFSDRP